MPDTSQNSIFVHFPNIYKSTNLITSISITADVQGQTMTAVPYNIDTQQEQHFPPTYPPDTLPCLTSCFISTSYVAGNIAATLQYTTTQKQI